jgi:hypothetical protein
MARGGSLAVGTLLVLGMAAARAPAADRCAYRYWPATAGLERDYTYLLRTLVSGRAPEESRADYTIAITERSGDDVTVRTVIQRHDGGDPQESSSISRCTDEGPHMRPRGAGESAGHYRGVEVPARLKPGTKWERDMIVAMPHGPRVIRTSYQALGREELDVPAGRFKTLRVAFQVRGRGKGAESYPVTSGTQWLARGVGLVRYVSRSTSDAGGTQITLETTHELAAVREAASPHQTRQASARTILEPAGHE